jgi:glutamate/aspartate transport system substrate-binding protein
VDGAIGELMQSGEMAKLYDKWFMQPIPPKNAALNLPLSPMLKGLFQQPNDKPLEAYQDKDGSGA